MKQRLLSKRPLSSGENHFGLTICIVLFACGVVIGTFAAGYINEEIFSDLYNEISGYAGLVEEGSFRQPGVLSVIWSTCKYHLLVVFLGFSLLGPICIPLVSGIKGFFLSFSIAAVIKALGGGGWLVAIGLFGLGSIISLPCFFLLGSGAFKMSLGLFRSISGTSKSGISVLYGRRFLTRACLCVLALMAAVMIELYVTPYFLSMVSAFL